MHIESAVRWVLLMLEPAKENNLLQMSQQVECVYH